MGWGVFLRKNFLVDKHTPEGRVLLSCHITAAIEKKQEQYADRDDMVILGMVPCNSKADAQVLHRKVWAAEESVKYVLMRIDTKEMPDLDLVALKNKTLKNLAVKMKGVKKVSRKKRTTK